MNLDDRLAHFGHIVISQLPRQPGTFRRKLEAFNRPSQIAGEQIPFARTQIDEDAGRAFSVSRQRHEHDATVIEQIQTAVEILVNPATESVAGIYGGFVRAAGAINTERMYANESAAAMARLNARDIWARNDQAIADLNAERKRQSANIETDRAADKQNWWGGKVIKGSEWLSESVRTVPSDSKTGRQTLQGRMAGSVIELGGRAYGLYQQYQSIQNRGDGKRRAVTEAFDARIANQFLCSRIAIAAT